MKKITLIILLISTLFLGCGEDSTTTTSDASTQTQTAVNTLDQNMTEEYQMYVEKTLSYRVQSYKLFEDIVGKETLSAAELISVQDMLHRYLDSKFETATRIGSYQYLVDERDDEYTQKERLELIMMSLSAMLLRYDDYLLSYSMYDDDAKLNDILNNGNGTDIPENTLDLDILYLYELESDRVEIRAMIEYYQDNLQYFENDTNTYFLYLKTLIEDSPSYQLGFEEEFFLFTILGDISDAIFLFADDLFDGFFSSLSENIGNTAGLVETREGYLYGDAEAAQNIRQVIQPGDILIERTPFRLTDKLIPGYWGHVAVYIGTKDELIEMGIWDDLNVTYNIDTNRTYQDDIENDQLIVEALRDGVQLNSIEHFLNVDDLAIMHDTSEYDTLNRTQRIKRVIEQLGKEYDFEYDIEDSSKIICSELVYISSIHIDWDTERFAGISTISPDNVAIKSTEVDTIFRIPLMYVNGELVTSDEKAYMTTVLEEYEE